MRLSARRRASALANTSAIRRRRCTSSSGHACSVLRLLQASEPTITPPTTSGTATSERTPSAATVRRSVPASSGSSLTLENCTTWPRPSRAFIQGKSLRFAATGKGEMPVRVQP